MKAKFHYGLFLLAATSCSSEPAFPSPGSLCKAACDHAAELECDQMLKPHGSTCEQACITYERNGGNFCCKQLLSAETCDELQSVAQEGCE